MIPELDRKVKYVKKQQENQLCPCFWHVLPSTSAVGQLIKAFVWLSLRIISLRILRFTCVGNTGHNKALLS